MKKFYFITWLNLVFIVNYQNQKKFKQQTMQKPKKQKQTNLTNFIKQNNSDNKKESVDSYLSKSQNQNQKNKTQSKKAEDKMVNVQFYRNIRVSEPNGDYIKKIHQNWWDNYSLLERHHGFIQWLFPNSFTSRFNSQSAALSNQEAKIFRSDLQIASRYVTSYQMMLQFYGMKLKSKRTGEIARSRNPDFRQRYVATLLTSFHNHMRITRILCSLTMIGLGRYAKQLSLFLKQQIHGQYGGLKPLAKYNVDKDWKDYQNYAQTPEDLNIYLKIIDSNFKKQKQEELKGNKQVQKPKEETKCEKVQRKVQKIQKPKQEKKNK